MLDTVRVKFPISPDPEELKYWTHKTSTTPTGTSESYIYNPKVSDDEVMLKYTYLPFDYTGKPILTLEFSLPKLLYGNNYQMLGSMDGTIKLANMYLAIIPHAPILDLAEGILIRLDMCYNHRVGDAVDDYLKAIGYLDYPHRRTKYHKYEGAEFLPHPPIPSRFWKLTTAPPSPDERSTWLYRLQTPSSGEGGRVGEETGRAYTQHWVMENYENC